MQQVKFENRLWLASPTMHGEEQAYVKEAFDTNWLAPLGPFVNKLESNFKDYMSDKLSNKEGNVSCNNPAPIFINSSYKTPLTISSVITISFCEIISPASIL